MRVDKLTNGRFKPWNAPVRQVARGIALLQQRTAAYAEAFAERVRMKALWLKGPTGGVVEFPE